MSFRLEGDAEMKNRGPCRGVPRPRCLLPCGLLCQSSRTLSAPGSDAPEARADSVGFGTVDPAVYWNQATIYFPPHRSLSRNGDPEQRPGARSNARRGPNFGRFQGGDLAGVLQEAGRRATSRSSVWTRIWMTPFRGAESRERHGRRHGPDVRDIMATGSRIGPPSIRPSERRTDLRAAGRGGARAGDPCADGCDRSTTPGPVMAEDPGVA